MRRLVALILVCTSAFAQLGTSSNSSDQEEAGHFVVHIDVNRVQVDAVVTDAKGRPVTGLNAKDFEILQDGVPQTITTFSYIAEGVKSAPATDKSSRAKSDSAIPAPPVPLAREQVRREIVLMVDDLGLSPTGVAYVRLALKKFVDREMQPGDLVAIVRTAGGMGALQQFTTDKRVLYAAIDQVKVHFMARASSFVPADLARSLDAPSIVGTGENNSPTFNAERYAAADAAEKCFEDTNSAIGSLGAIRYIVQGLRDVPGRKALILFSEKMQISERPDQVDSDKQCQNYRTVEAVLRRVTDAAERSGVVIYTIDPHGLDPLVGDASSNPFGGGPLRNEQSPVDVLNNQLKEASIADFFAKGGLLKLARETGGTFAFHNDTAGAIREAVNDSSNYYLLGYRPPARTFEGKNASQKFHVIAVKVKRGGLRVRSRSGFYGVPGTGTETSSLSKTQQFVRALMSPFAENDIHLRITSFFSEVNKPLLTTFVYIDANDLSFTSAADSSHKSTVTAISATFDKNGGVVDSVQQTYTLGRTQNDDTRDQRGAILTLQQVVAKPGPYQVRVAVRDAVSGKMGSANQFVEVPDLKRGRLALSGILLKRAVPPEAVHDVSRGSNQNQNSETEASEAIRIFKPGDTIRWYYEIFNAKSGLDQHSSLKVQVRIFRDGSLFMQSQPAPAHLFQDPSTSYVGTSGHMLLGTTFTPGDYALQVIVKDELAKKHSTAWQWIGFEVQNP